ncbi:hypothetical protein FAM8407_02924 [Lacticaseibacillus paracasei]|nr:hypothetical protein FAM8407_02924 [Lacticaseibacillus paracasei]
MFWLKVKVADLTDLAEFNSTLLGQADWHSIVRDIRQVGHLVMKLLVVGLDLLVEFLNLITKLPGLLDGCISGFTIALSFTNLFRSGVALSLHGFGLLQEFPPLLVKSQDLIDLFAHAITTDTWRNSLDHYQEFVIIVALDLKIEG